MGPLEPTTLAFTTVKRSWMCPGGEMTNFDILPLILQLSPDTAPQLYDVPQDLIPEVPLTHPQYSWFKDLKLKVHTW